MSSSFSIKVIFISENQRVLKNDKLITIKPYKFANIE